MAWTMTQIARWVREQRTGHAIRKSILYTLASHSDKHGVANPTTRLMAEEAECDQKTVRDHLVVLIDQGLVRVDKVGRGRAASYYRLLLGANRSEGPNPSLRSIASEGPSPLTSEPRSEGLDDRSEGQRSRSEGERGSEQRKREHEVVPTVLEELQEEAAPPLSRVPARRGARTPARGRREIVTPAELNATAHSPGAHGLVTAWAARRPGHLAPHRRALAREVDRLLTAGADPAVMATALDQAHDDPQWRDPVKALPYAYRNAIRARHGPPVGTAAPGRTDQNIAEFLSRSIGQTVQPQRAIGGNP